MAAHLSWHRATLEIDDFTGEEIWNRKCYLIVLLQKIVELCVILLWIISKIMIQNSYTLVQFLSFFFKTL